MRYKSSRTSSNEAESLPELSTIGKRREISPGISGLASSASRARIQFLFPRTVFISPL